MADDLPEVEQLTIMISSTRTDLMQYREEASKVIKGLAEDFERRLQLVEISMEKEVQSGERELAVDVSKRWVEESSWVVLIVGWKYGTISPDPKFGGISVTEWEYRYACELGKKVFCFVVGEPDTINHYRVADEEARVDLKDTILSESEAHRVKLKAFKDSLSPTYLDYFKNLKHFSERLEKTLRASITLPIEPGSDLAELLLAVRPSIQQCIDRVKIIAACKRVHDHLHELRQNVIRPILESALVQWRADGHLGIALAAMIANRAGFSEALVRSIQAEIGNLSPKREYLLRALARVVAASPQCDFQSGEPELNEFARTVTRFAGHRAGSLHPRRRCDAEGLQCPRRPARLAAETHRRRAAAAPAQRRRGSDAQRPIGARRAHQEASDRRPRRTSQLAAAARSARHAQRVQENAGVRRAVDRTISTTTCRN